MRLDIPFQRVQAGKMASVNDEIYHFYPVPRWQK